MQTATRQVLADSSAAHPMAASLGTFIGGAVLITILAAVGEKLVFQRVFDDPVKGKLCSVLVAWLIAGTIGGFGYADGGPFQTIAYVYYLLPAIVIGLWFYRRGVVIRDETNASE